MVAVVSRSSSRWSSPPAGIARAPSSRRACAPTRSTCSCSSRFCRSCCSSAVQRRAVRHAAGNRRRRAAARSGHRDGRSHQRVREHPRARRAGDCVRRDAAWAAIRRSVRRCSRGIAISTKASSRCSSPTATASSTKSCRCGRWEATGRSEDRPYFADSAAHPGAGDFGRHRRAHFAPADRHHRRADRRRRRRVQRRGGRVAGSLEVPAVRRGLPDARRSDRHDRRSARPCDLRAPGRAPSVLAEPGARPAAAGASCRRTTGCSATPA